MRPNVRSSTCASASAPRGRSRHCTPGRIDSCSSPCAVASKNTRVVPGAPLRWRATSRAVTAGERLITRRSAGPWLASTISSSCAEQTKTPSAPRAARKWWMLGEMSSVSSSTSIFIGSSSSALGGRMYYAVAALAHRLVDVRLGAREQHFVVVSVAGERDAPHAECDLPRTAGVGRERDLLDVSAYALGHAGGVPALGVEQQDRDDVVQPTYHVGRAEKLSDLSGYRLLQVLAEPLRARIGSNETDGEEVLVARGALGFPRQQVPERILDE